MQFEVRRQLFHIIMGSIIVFLIYLNIITFKVTLVILFIGLLLSYLSKFHDVPVLTWLMDMFERNEDKLKFPGRGALLYMLGVLFSLFFFEKNIAMASLLILSVGDSISPLIGKTYGKVKYTNKKMIEGILAGAVAAGFAASLFVQIEPAFVAAIGAMLIEGLDLKIGINKVDDNLIIPLVAGIILSSMA